MLRLFVAIGAVAALIAAAAAQTPVFSVPLERAAVADNYRRLPFRDIGNEIRIEVSADLLYSFEDGKVRVSASDLLEQAAKPDLRAGQVAGAHRVPLRPNAGRGGAEASGRLRHGAVGISGQGGKGHQCEIRRHWRPRTAAGAARSARSVCAVTAAAEQSADRVWQEVRESGSVNSAHSRASGNPVVYIRLFLLDLVPPF